LERDYYVEIRSWPALNNPGAPKLFFEFGFFFGQLLQYYCTLSFIDSWIAEIAIELDILFFEKSLHDTLILGRWNHALA
jgi:hypothetical protein